MTPSKIGKIFAVKLPNGLYFVVAWVDGLWTVTGRIDKSKFKVVVTEDGYGVETRKLETVPTDPSEILDGLYSWAENEEDFVVATLKDEVDKVKADVSSEGDKWTVKRILDVDEECHRTFANKKAVSAVTPRRSPHNSLTVLRPTPIAFASSPWVISKGSKNSSLSIVPTLVG